MSVDIVIAVRGGGKSRLSRLLSPDQREAIVAAMLSDMLGRLGDGGGRLHVVTPTPALAALARAAGAAVIPDRGAGLNHAFAAARRMLPGVVLALPGDLPLASSADVARMRAAGAPDRAVLAGTRGGGTGAVLLPQGLPFRFAFGADSLARHLEGGAIAVEVPGLALDIDTPEDVAALLATDARGRAADLLRAFGSGGNPPE